MFDPVAFAMSTFLAAAQAHMLGDPRLESYSFRTYDGQAHTAELGHLSVQENRSGSSKERIQLGFVRLLTYCREMF